jgi:ribA/ribD-fused uncharacterized protein
MNVITGFYGRWAFLSNFYPSMLTWEGITYPTAEHAYNAGKTTARYLRYALAEAPTPQKAKRLGRGMDLRPDWEDARFDVMRAVLHAKFTCHPKRIEALRSTGDAVLIEGNRWHDQVWGDCYCGRQKCTEPGVNNLGFMLMELRTQMEAQC